MKRFTKLTLVSAISMGLAVVSGSAFAVNNGDFEADVAAIDGDDPTDWTLSDSGAAGLDMVDGNGTSAHGGDYFLNLGFAAAAAGDLATVTASSDATEDLTGCSPYDLGEWVAAGWYNTRGDDEASFRVDFDSGEYDESGGLTSTGPDGWTEAMLGGNVPEAATSATATVGATAVTSFDDKADANWDDVSFTPDCVTDYAKISGKFKDPSLEGEGGLFQRGWVSFDGAFGHLESGKLVGSLYWNDKKAGVSCTAAPDPADFFLYGDDIPAPNDNYEAVYAITYECSEGTEGKALFFFDVDGGATHGGKNKDKFDRGCWKLSNYETDSSPDLYELYDCLDNGNVDVMEPPEV